jgi:restriction system protein
MGVESTLPSQAAFHYAVLKHLSQYPSGDARDNIQRALPDILGLTEAQRTERLANLKHLRYRHRGGWAISILHSARYVENPTRGFWCITNRGRELLARFPNGFDDETGRRVIREGREAVQPAATASGTRTVLEQTPDERIEAAMQEIRQVVTGELLDRIAQSPPSFFEQLVLDVLHALGYGGSQDDLEHVGHAGDGGIDGVIALDRLGFEKVYVQAKRWQGPVGRPEVQAFYGALAGHHARKGVFITSSAFTREARAFAESLPERIILIDGVRLTSLMIDYAVGVSHYRAIHLPKLDEDYFIA